MASEIQVSNKKRKSRGKQMMKNKPRDFPGGGAGRKPKIDKRTKRLFQKRARNYNSDEEEEDKEEETKDDDKDIDITEKEEEDELDDEMELEDEDELDDEEDAVQPGIAKFSEGCKAFRTAFTSITNKSVANDALGPVLSGHIKLLAEKLAQEESQRLVKGVAKKEKLLLSEKGHVKPANFLDAHDKFLIGVATKGVVRLFNAVNKAQNAQKGLNPSRFKDAKEVWKRKKQAFFTELRKKTSQGAASTATDGSDEPAWAPLRDSYMLTNSKLKNWDKMPDNTVGDDTADAVSHGSSSDED